MEYRIEKRKRNAESGVSFFDGGATKQMVAG